MPPEVLKSRDATVAHFWHPHFKFHGQSCLGPVPPKLTDLLKENSLATSSSSCLCPFSVRICICESSKLKASSVGDLL